MSGLGELVGSREKTNRKQDGRFRKGEIGNLTCFFACSACYYAKSLVVWYTLFRPESENPSD